MLLKDNYMIKAEDDHSLQKVMVEAHEIDRDLIKQNNGEVLY